MHFGKQLINRPGSRRSNVLETSRAFELS